MTRRGPKEPRGGQSRRRAELVRHKKVAAARALRAATCLSLALRGAGDPCLAPVVADVHRAERGGRCSRALDQAARPQWDWRWFRICMGARLSPKQTASRSLAVTERLMLTAT